MPVDSEIKTLSLYPIDYPFETLVTRVAADPPKLKLDPDFQRKYKWDNDGWERASRFIESCLMRIPLPSCYFAEEDNGRHLVIDGVQRITTIHRFFDNGFALEGLTIFKELEGKKFSDLGSLRDDLESTTIRCIVLRKENPKELIREIFSRLNQGAVRLSDQEIRHAIYPGPLDKLLSELGKQELIARFGLAENSDVARDSLEPEEQVLRFFAYLENNWQEMFGANLKNFLDSYTQRYYDLSKEDASRLRRSFEKAMENCVLVFGDDVFTNPTAQRKRKGLIHYDLLMPSVGRLDSALVREKKEKIRNAYETLCGSEEFKKASSGGLQNKSSIARRKERWGNLLSDALK